MKIFCAIAVVADLALAALLVALSGFIFGGGPEGMHGEASAAIAWWAAFIATLAAAVLGILLLRRGRPGIGVLIAWAPVVVSLLFASTAFSEPDKNTPKGAVVWRWFERADKQLFFFAGIWRPWTGDRGTKKTPNIGDHSLFSIMTTEPNAVVKPIHEKAMPVMLMTPVPVRASHVPAAFSLGPAGHAGRPTALARS